MSDLTQDVADLQASEAAMETRVLAEVAKELEDHAAAAEQDTTARTTIAANLRGMAARLNAFNLPPTPIPPTAPEPDPAAASPAPDAAASPETPALIPSAAPVGVMPDVPLPPASPDDPKEVGTGGTPAPTEPPTVDALPAETPLPAEGAAEPTEGTAAPEPAPDVAAVEPDAAEEPVPTAN